MDSSQRFKRNPAIICWIKHLNEGKFSNEERVLYTIFGKIKRVRVVGTIINKQESINENRFDNKSFSIDDEESNTKIELELDDDTGIIKIVMWNINIENYENIKKGDIVDVIGLLRKKNDELTIGYEIIRKIQNPNFILLRNAEIINKIKTQGKHEIPDIDESESNVDLFLDEIDIESLFEDDIIEDNEKKETNLGKNNQSFERNDFDEIKSNIFSILEDKGKGVNIEELNERLEIPEIEIKKYLGDLEMEGKIYQSGKGIWEVY